jgi:ParE toxin of type II toxin-antitoxin system, parDE
MSYKVTWRPSAEQQLAALWVNAPDQNDVTAAANRIDDLLERSPLGEGVSRFGASRIRTVPPLAVYYDVDQNAREVFVWAVWRRG